MRNCVDGPKTIQDSLRVIETLDADAQPHCIVQPQRGANHASALLYRCLAAQEPIGGHSIEIG